MNVTDMKVHEDDVCCNCGNSLIWHLKQRGNNKVYIMDIGDMVCSKRCHKEYAMSYMQIERVITRSDQNE